MKIKILVVGFQMIGIISMLLADESYAEGRVIVKFKPGNQAAVSMAASLLGDSEERVNDLGGDTFTIGLDKNNNIVEAIEMLNSAEEVEYVEPDYTRFPNDDKIEPYGYTERRSSATPCLEPKSIKKSFLEKLKLSMPKSKSLAVIPYINKQWALEKIHCTSGWKFNKGKRDVIIAVLDSGVTLDHPDLIQSLIPGFNAIKIAEQPTDEEGHGTHCAGILGAQKSQLEGVDGIAAGCSIMPIKVLYNGIGFASWIAKGIRKAVDSGAKVISMSLGSPNESKTEREAIEYAISKGVIIVASAGNKGKDMKDWPAAYPGVISVASADHGDRRSEFSNYGQTVDLAAPGSDIYSTMPSGGYGYMSGTSMATPFVAGLAALIFSAAPQAKASEVISIMTDTAKPVGTWVKHGLINVNKALGKAYKFFGLEKPKQKQMLRKHSSPHCARRNDQIDLRSSENNSRRNALPDLFYTEVM